MRTDVETDNVRFWTPQEKNDNNTTMYVTRISYIYNKRTVHPNVSQDSMWWANRPHHIVIHQQTLKISWINIHYKVKCSCDCASIITKRNGMNVLACRWNCWKVGKGHPQLARDWSTALQSTKVKEEAVGMITGNAETSIKSELLHEASSGRGSAGAFQTPRVHSWLTDSSVRLFQRL